MIDYSAMLDLAMELARSAGEAVRDMRAEAVAGAETKSSPTDPVTAADRAAEKIVVDGILAARPDDAIVGEEGTDRPGTTGIRWHVDPIDGTTNYLYDIPAFSVSIGVELADRVEVGVVYNPTNDELFHARRGGGAYLGDDPIRVSSPRDLSAGLITTGFGYLPQRRRRQGEIVAELLPRIRDIRRFGSAALDLCSLAAGRVDAYFEAGLNSWDYTAGSLIAAEAGASVGDLRGGAPSSTFLIGVSPDIETELIELLRSLDADVLPS